MRCRANAYLIPSRMVIVVKRYVLRLAGPVEFQPCAVEVAISSVDWITEEDCNIDRGTSVHTAQVEIVKVGWRGPVHAANGLGAGLNEESRRFSTGSSEREERKGEESNNWIGGLHLSLIFGGVNGLIVDCLNNAAVWRK